MTIARTLIAESLRVGASLDGVALNVTRISRAEAGVTEVGQPLVWTFVDFETPDAEADRLATALSYALDEELGWYCDFRSPTETFVVFAGRVFSYPRGDQAERSDVEAYARSVGVPESQLDWPE
jgi:hypothetical protein